VIDCSFNLSIMKSEIPSVLKVASSSLTILGINSFFFEKDDVVVCVCVVVCVGVEE